MLHKVNVGKKTRMSFSRINEILDMPDLIEVQKDSYRQFIEKGLGEVLDDISPIKDFSERLVLEFVGYKIDESKPKRSVAECKERDVNYCAPLYVIARLINTETGSVKQQEVFMGDFPLMTEQGTFVINGAERVIVSQLVRSPGAYYTETVDKVGRRLFNSQVIPNRGAWLEYETDSNEILYTKIDRQRKLHVTTLLRALGYSSDAQILELLGEEERLKNTLEKDPTHDTVEGLIEIYKRQRPGEPPTEESAGRDARVKAGAEQARQTGLAEALVIGPLPRIVKVGGEAQLLAALFLDLAPCGIVGVLRLVARGVDIVHAALEAGLHHGKVLIRQGQIQHGIRADVADEHTQRGDVIGVDLGRGDDGLRLPGELFLEGVALRLCAAGEHELRKQAVILTALLNGDLCNAAAANDQ